MSYLAREEKVSPEQLATYYEDPDKYGLTPAAGAAPTTTTAATATLGVGQTEAFTNAMDQLEFSGQGGLAYLFRQYPDEYEPWLRQQAGMDASGGTTDLQNQYMQAEIANMQGTNSRANTAMLEPYMSDVYGRVAPAGSYTQGYEPGGTMSQIANIQGVPYNAEPYMAAPISQDPEYMRLMQMRRSLGLE